MKVTILLPFFSLFIASPLSAMEKSTRETLSPTQATQNSLRPSDAPAAKRQCVEGDAESYSEPDKNCNTQKSLNNAALITAVASNREQDVQKLLKEPDIDINTQNHNGLTPLMCAAYNGNEKIVQLLLNHQQYAHVNLISHAGCTALMYAAEHAKVIKLLLARPDIGIVIQNRSGETAATLAALYGTKETMQLFGVTGLTHALMAAKRAHRGDILQVLLDKISNVQDENGTTPLMVAIMQDWADVIQILLTQTAINLNVQDTGGRTALMWAVEQAQVETVQSLLLALPENTINTRNQTGATALMVAASRGCIQITQLLLARRDININVQNQNGQTALMLACSKGHSEIAELLINHSGININVQDHAGETALMLAARSDHRNIVHLLLKMPGIDMHIKNNSGQTAFMIAENSGFLQTAQLLRSHEINYIRVL